MIRTEGDLVLATNMGSELTVLVKQYLLAYKRICNGINGISIENDNFGIMLLGMKERTVNVAVIDYDTYELCVANDNDRGYGYGYDDDENWGYGGGHSSSSYNITTEGMWRTTAIVIPINHLLTDEYEDILKT